jgi:peptidoglycan LD-endopeptidase CwlK
MSRDLNEATPRMKEFALKLIGLAKEELGIKVIVTDVARQYEVQVALYAQGRETLENVNKLRKRAKLAPITHKENRKVTWTLASRHIINLSNDDPTDDLSHAIDFGILDKNGKYMGDIKADVNKDNKSDYIQLGTLAKKIDKDIIWGGDWSKSKDYPHFEEPKWINPA